MLALHLATAPARSDPDPGRASAPEATGTGQGVGPPQTCPLAGSAVSGAAIAMTSALRAIRGRDISAVILVTTVTYVATLAPQPEWLLALWQA